MAEQTKVEGGSMLAHSMLAHLDIVKRDVETLLYMVAQNLGNPYDASDLARVVALVSLEARMRVLMEYQLERK